ncbi:sigma-70 family RNA polymerase sigma factor [Lentzea tibetensis]|uniref:Sigma-70 family RNA polymerase sigma factor n=1 Tax=Lentzea tibetensis TaxID=2591470 RepID=A0A563EVK4_9PSEU|nr:sigma-70 family RNA polymerase sigma factor [Lentzea tibetensis]TWP51747.1 sigma-70 family RNA polymerase sigma factor [Lentzea tibetensis]
MSDRRPLSHEQLGALLTAAGKGDRASLEAIVRELTPLLWQVARAQGLDREASADVVQTTWLRLLRSLTDIRAPGALVSWLVTVAKREAWQVSRAQRSERVVAELPDEPDSGAEPGERVAISDRNRRLWTAVSMLSERCQYLLRVVAFMHRPDYDLIAAALGMRRGSVGPQRGRCIDRLRRLLTSVPAEQGGEW